MLILLVLLGYCSNPTGDICQSASAFLGTLMLQNVFVGRHRNHWVWVSLCHWVEGREMQGVTATIATTRYVCQGK